MLRGRINLLSLGKDDARALGREHQGLHWAIVWLWWR
jgi:hypothetical protein